MHDVNAIYPSAGRAEPIRQFGSGSENGFSCSQRSHRRRNRCERSKLPVSLCIGRNTDHQRMRRGPSCLRALRYFLIFLFTFTIPEYGFRFTDPFNRFTWVGKLLTSFYGRTSVSSERLSSPSWSVPESTPMYSPQCWWLVSGGVPRPMTLLRSALKHNELCRRPLTAAR